MKCKNERFKKNGGFLKVVWPDEDRYGDLWAGQERGKKDEEIKSCCVSWASDRPTVFTQQAGP